MSVSSPAAGAATIAKILDKSNRAARLVGRIRCAFALGLNKTFNTENTRNHSYGNVGSDSEVTHRADRTAARRTRQAGVATTTMQVSFEPKDSSVIRLLHQPVGEDRRENWPTDHPEARLRSSVRGKSADMMGSR